MLYQNIENLPLAPLGTSTQLFDFDALPPATASGYTSVLPTTLYDPARTYPDPERKYQHTTYGWDVPLISGGQSTQGAFDRGVGSSPVYDELLRDGHFAHDARHFRADVAAGWYLVSAKLGDLTIGRDQMQITDGYTNAVLAGPLSTAAGQFVSVSFAVHVPSVPSGQPLDLVFSDLGGEPNWVLNGLEIRPGKLFDIGAPLPASLQTPGEQLRGRGDGGHVHGVRGYAGRVVCRGTWSRSARTWARWWRRRTWRRALRACRWRWRTTVVCRRTWRGSTCSDRRVPGRRRFR